MRKHEIELSYCKRLTSTINLLAIARSMFTGRIGFPATIDFS